MFFARTLILALAALPSVASAAEWRAAYQGGSAPNRQAVFLEQGSLKRSGEIVRYWHQEVLETPATEGEDKIVSYREANCSDISERVLQSTYWGSGKILQTDTSPRERRYRAPGSVGHMVITIACGLPDLMADEAAYPEALPPEFRAVPDPESFARESWQR